MGNRQKSKNTAAKKKTDSTPKSEARASGKTMEVLYQKMGGRWYAFTVFEEDVYVGEVDPDTVETVADIYQEDVKKQPKRRDQDSDRTDQKKNPERPEKSGQYCVALEPTGF